MVLDQNETPIGILLLTVLLSIVEVFLLCLAGYLLAWRGILDKPTQKKINHLNVSLFTPALLFSKVAFFLTPAKIIELWVIPVSFVIMTVTSMAIAYALSSVFRLKNSQRAFAIAASMFMNSNSLPIALMQSLVVTVPAGLEWGDDDTLNAMLGRALTYLVIHSTLGMVLRWSYGVRLLSQADDTAQDDEQNDAHTPLPHRSPAPSLLENNERTPLMLAAHPAPSVFKGAPRLLTKDIERGYTLPYGSTGPYRQRTSSNSSSSTQSSRFSATVIGESRSKNASQTKLPTSASSASMHQASPAIYVVDTQPKVEPEQQQSGFLSRIRNGWNKVNDFMTAPLWASLAALIVACIPPLQHFLDHDVTPVKGALNAAGNCSIPLTLVVLGAYFYTPPAEGDEKGKTTAVMEALRVEVEDSESDWDSVDDSDDEDDMWDRVRQWSVTGETRTVIVAVLSRMVLTPMLLIPLIAFSSHLGWDEILQDPIFIIANVLLIASPPALTLAQLTQKAASGDAFERLISRTVFWSYCIVTPPSTILFVFVGMLIVKSI
ncbi:hypothetical protein AX16_004801 [Volvariella volvacea WC 439]|nr:hypothetical protein AX16_004801 [Volvariella volvacea WC 439]